jgi:hypothetical protein
LKFGRGAPVFYSFGPPCCAGLAQMLAILGTLSSSRYISSTTKSPMLLSSRTSFNGAYSDDSYAAASIAAAQISSTTAMSAATHT